MHTEPADMDVVARVLSGEAAAYAILVDRYQNFVFTIVLRYVKNREDAEELAQDIFVKAYRFLSGFKGDARFSTWLYTVTTSSCLSFLRKHREQLQSLDEEPVLAAASALAADTGGIEVERKDRARLVNEALSLLSVDDARVITLFYKGEQTIEEMAQVMGKAPNAVKVQLHRARARLKEKMETHFSREVNDLY